MMIKKLFSIFAILIFTTLLASCQLVVNEEERTTSTQDNLTRLTKEMIAFRVEQDNKIEYYGIQDDYKDDYPTSPFFVTKNYTIHSSYENEKLVATEITIDVKFYYNFSTEENQTLKVSEIFLFGDGRIEESIRTHFNVFVSSVSRTYVREVDGVKDSVKFNLEIIDIDELIEYTVIEYDINNNKIKETTIDLTTLGNDPIEIQLTSQTVDYKIIENYLDHDGTNYSIKKLYLVTDIINSTNNEFKTDIFTINQLNEKCKLTFKYVIK